MKAASVLRYALYSALGIITGLIICETGLQVIARTPLAKVLPLIEPQLGQPDSDIGYEFVPSTKAVWSRENRALVKINDDGLRDGAINKDREDNAYRIILSGDSMVEALQVENDKVFDNLTENLLRQAGYPVDILNFGLSGSGPLRQLIRMEKKAAALSPDLTIMLMSASDFISGELRDDSEGPAYTLEPDGTTVRSFGFRNRVSQRYANTLPGRIILNLLRHSHVFRMLYQKRRDPLTSLLGLPPSAVPRDTTPPANDVCQTDPLRRQYEFWVGHTPDPDWRILQAFLAETAIYAEGHDIAIGMYLPLAAAGCTEENEQRQKIIHAITRALAIYKIDFIDWNNAVYEQLSIKAEMPDMNALHGFGTKVGAGHLNYKGHDIYAHTLMEKILPYIKDKKSR